MNPATIMSEELQKKAEEAAITDPRTVESLEAQVSNFPFDPHTKFIASIAISLKRLADYLERSA